jgi:hypothetical protein
MANMRSFIAVICRLVSRRNVMSILLAYKVLVLQEGRDFLQKTVFVKPNPAFWVGNVKSNGICHASLANGDNISLCLLEVKQLPQ